MDIAWISIGIGLLSLTINIMVGWDKLKEWYSREFIIKVIKKHTYLLSISAFMTIGKLILFFIQEGILRGLVMTLVIFVIGYPFLAFVIVCFEYLSKKFKTFFINIKDEFH